MIKVFVQTERKVRIDRNPKGGLGISVKGGSEHNIPVIISRVFTQPINGMVLCFKLALSWFKSKPYLVVV